MHLFQADFQHQVELPVRNVNRPPNTNSISPQRISMFSNADFRLTRSLDVPPCALLWEENGHAAVHSSISAGTLVKEDSKRFRRRNVVCKKCQLMNTNSETLPVLKQINMQPFSSQSPEFPF